VSAIPPTALAAEGLTARLSRPGVLAFAVLYGLEAMTYACLSTVIPLQTLALFGTAQNASLVYTAVGLSGLVGVFVVPRLVRRIRVRATYAVGAATLLAGAGLMATGAPAGQALGMTARTLGGSCLRVSLNVLTLGHVARRDFTRSEPLKLFFGALPWTLGPFLGVWLFETVGSWAAFGLSGACAVALGCYSWVVAGNDRRPLPAQTRAPVAGLAALRRYAAQPRLRLAWVIAFGRNAWWVMYFVYVPMFMMESGAGRMVGGILVSAASLGQLLTPAMGWLGRRYGLRRVLPTAFVTCGTLTLGAVVLADAPYSAAVALLLGAFAAPALDALGDIPFLRAVRSYERPEMAAVFNTHGAVAALVVPLAFGAILSRFDLSAVFAASGLSMFAFAVLCRYFPRRL
jgi:MFS family permease